MIYDYITTKPPLDEDTLAHYGIKGMKWKNHIYAVKKALTNGYGQARNRVLTMLPQLQNRLMLLMLVVVRKLAQCIQQLERKLMLLMLVVVRKPAQCIQQLERKLMLLMLVEVRKPVQCIRQLERKLTLLMLVVKRRLDPCIRQLERNFPNTNQEQKQKYPQG